MPMRRDIKRLLKIGYRASRSALRAQVGLLERPFGLETSRMVGRDELGLVGEQRHYEPAGWLTLRRVLRKGEVSEDDVFIDLGSGKGRVVLQAARYPFRRVIGVEISESLNEVARRNVERMPGLRCKQVDIVTADLAECEIPDDVTVAFIYNPVRGELFSAVVDKLLASYDRRPRDLRLIYRIPLEEPRLTRTGRFRMLKSIRGIRPWSPESAIRVYSVLPRHDREEGSQVQPASSRGGWLPQ
jgi:SAM-dependent methyltransferase